MAEMHRSLSRLRSLAPVLLGKEVPTHAHTDGLAACFVGVDRGRLRHLVPYPRAGPHYPPTPPAAHPRRNRAGSRFRCRAANFVDPWGETGSSARPVPAHALA